MQQLYFKHFSLVRNLKSKVTVLGAWEVLKNELALQNAPTLTGEDQATGMAKDELW